MVGLVFPADFKRQWYMIDLSIIIVSWNTQKLLKECLCSIKETVGDLRTETIVVDNGSRDGSVEAIKKGFHWVTLIENGRNLGFASANNIGIRRSSGRYVCLVNSDVVILPGCLQTLYSYMEEHQRVGMAGPKMLDRDGIPRRSTMFFPSYLNNFFRSIALDSLFPKSFLFGKYLMGYEDRTMTMQADVLNGFFWIIRRESLDEVGLLDESFFMYGEDIDFCKRFALKGWSRVFVSDAAAIHYGGASSANAPTRFYLEMQKANLRYWRKHLGTVGGMYYRAILSLHHIFRIMGHAIRITIASPPSEDERFKMNRSKAVLHWLFGKTAP